MYLNTHAADPTSNTYHTITTDFVFVLFSFCVTPDRNSSVNISRAPVTYGMKTKQELDPPINLESGFQVKQSRGKGPHGREERKHRPFFRKNTPNLPRNVAYLTRHDTKLPETLRSWPKFCNRIQSRLEGKQSKTAQHIHTVKGINTSKYFFRCRCVNLPY